LFFLRKYKGICILHNHANQKTPAVYRGSPLLSGSEELFVKVCNATKIFAH